MRKFVCDLCNGSDYLVLYPARGSFTGSYLITDKSYGQHLQIVKCLQCQLTQCYPQTTTKQTISRYQSFVDPEYEREASNRSRNYDRILDCIKKHNTSGKLLDVGCATGLLVDRANMYGWQAEGIEPSAWAVKLARLKGLKIHLGTLATARLKPSSYDAITCVDVIEHVNSPRNLINQMSKLLKPNGILIVVTPNSSSLLARIMGEKWWHIRPDHFYYFSPHTLSTVCANAGLKLSFIGTYAWTFSLRYWLSRIGITTSNATWPVSIDLHDSILGCFSRNGGNIGPS